MNTNQPQAIQTIPTQIPDMTQISLDPHNPLIWLLLIATLCNAIANLLRALAPFLKRSRNGK